MDYPLELFTGTVVEALAHGITGGHLVGNSLGGGVALQIALDHPQFAVDRLVLMAPGCVAEQASYFTMPGIAKMVSNFGGPDFNLKNNAGWSRTSSTRISRRRSPMRWWPSALLSPHPAEGCADADEDPEPGVAACFRVACPIFVLWGLK